MDQESNQKGIHAVIYIKRGSFLPDHLVVFRGIRIIFKNEDAQNYTVQCKGRIGIPSFKLESGTSYNICFQKSGKYQFTFVSNTSVKASTIQSTLYNLIEIIINYSR
jgi:plastocyanin